MEAFQLQLVGKRANQNAQKGHQNNPEMDRGRTMTRS